MASISNPATELVLKDSPANRPKAIGLNSNVSVRGTQFHVQTEDLWPNCPQIVTHVFGEGGHVVQVARIDYAQHLGKPNLRRLLPKVMKVHHASIVSKLSRQSADEYTLESTLRSSPDSPIGPEAVDASPQALPVRREDPVEDDSTEDRHPGSGSFKIASASPQASPIHCEDSIKDESPEDHHPNNGALKVAARTIWDRLVAEAQRVRQSAESADEFEESAPAASSVTRSTPVEMEPPSLSRCGWDLAVESHRQGAAQLEPAQAALAMLPDPATEAHDAGLKQMRKPDKTKALVCFARAVQLDPHNTRYRASLRHALDWLDRHERVTR